jgi:Outer membrane protein beta-barrel domain
MKTMLRAALAMVVMAGSAFAQEAPKADVSMGYSYLRLGGSGGLGQQGGAISMAGYFNNWLGIAGDFGAYHASESGGSVNTFTFLAGPRIAANRKGSVSPFFQVLFGGAHLTASAAGLSGGVTPFAISAGTGVDLRISKHVALRPQLDYMPLRSGGETLSTVRGSFGVVFGFGER